MSITGVLGAVWATGGSSTAFTDEATTKNADFSRWSMNNAVKRYIDDGNPVTVKKNTVVQSTGFTIEMAGGVVVFNPALLTTDVVTISGKYFTLTQCLTMFGWKLDINKDLKDVTTFQSNGWKEQIAGIGSWTASADGYWADGSFLALVGSRMMMSFFVDDVALKKYEGYVIVKKDSIDEPVDNVVKESIDLEGTGQIYYHEG